MKDFLKPSLVLFGTGLVSGLLLAFVFSAAKPVIDKNELKEKEAARLEVFPSAEPIELKEHKFTDNHKDYRFFAVHNPAGILQGYIIETESAGYNPGILIIAGFNKEGLLTGAKILKDNETPGLGKKLHDKNFRSQFYGMNIKTLPLSKAEFNSAYNNGKKLDAISGATLSSLGLTRGIRETGEKIFELVKSPEIKK
ncbi:MAG: hypothetical protein A2096_12760 [Spirochaetes bacterium GWF1_41_5]|nr:MAG: hypothetical protein A2096_12760 [Spirochaetes bacterium GWF1_41_5]HBE04850.1 hypothetical protein [Spirochaetia bacterium]